MIVGYGGGDVLLGDILVSIREYKLKGFGIGSDYLYIIFLMKMFFIKMGF